MYNHQGVSFIKVLFSSMFRKCDTFISYRFSTSVLGMKLSSFHVLLISYEQDTMVIFFAFVSDVYLRLYIFCCVFVCKRVLCRFVSLFERFYIQLYVLKSASAYFCIKF